MPEDSGKPTKSKKHNIHREASTTTAGAHNIGDTTPVEFGPDNSLDSFMVGISWMGGGNFAEMSLETKCSGMAGGRDASAVGSRIDAQERYSSPHFREVSVSRQHPYLQQVRKYVGNGGESRDLKPSILRFYEGSQLLQVHRRASKSLDQSISFEFSSRKVLSFEFSPIDTTIVGNHTIEK